jgi:hypothetical protein
MKEAASYDTASDNVIRSEDILYHLPTKVTSLYIHLF